MKKIRKFFLFLFGLIVILGVAIYGYLYSTKPQYEGELALSNLSDKTEVYFDEYGIPHIYAQNQKDANVALGYVHAQERLWQMELLRRIAPGKLSEIFGTRALDNDKLFLALGIDDHSEEMIKKIDKNSQAYILAQAYLDGINQYLENGKTPIEFTLLGLEKKPFTIKDVFNIYGYMAFSFAMAHKTDPLMTDIRNKWGDEYVKELGLNLEYNPTKIKSFNGKAITNYTQIATAVTQIMEQSPVPAFIGSNAWVLGPKKTKSGKVLFSNDPHIEYSQPGTWYEAHISCPDYEMYGYYLAGTPYPLLGHNRQYAYGLTMFENDDADFYEEKNNPKDSNQYQSGKSFLNYKTRSKTIKVKDSANVVLNLKETHHGTLINGILKNFNPKSPISLFWIYTHKDNKILDAVYSLSHAKNHQEFHDGISHIAGPGLNIMYGDAKNNYAWKTSGKLYQFDKGVNPNFILNGFNGKDDQAKFLPFEKNPGALNPSWNYVYSANNMPEAIDGYEYQGYYLPQDRAKRITQLLNSKEKWDKNDFTKMLVDNVSTESVRITKNALASINTKGFSKNELKAYELLWTWGGGSDVKLVAPTIYNKFIFHYLKNTFHDEMGDIGFKQFLKTHIMKQTIVFQINDELSVWWDNVKTPNVAETNSSIITQSFRQAVKSLESQLGKNINDWNWGKVHHVEYKHPLGSVKLLQPFFNVGIFSIAGQNEVINNTMFEFSDEPILQVKAGPSTRRIVDFSDVENSLSILPTGQSGNPMSKHYNDQAQMYIDGKFRKMKMNKKEIMASSTKLIFNVK